jgi:aarF domain-containing kinase
MKWGQWAATRADIFPPDMCVELAKLQTKAPAHSLAHTERTVRHALGKKDSRVPCMCRHSNAVTCLL